ncbi:MAG: hypothetical protein AMXMBFR33_42820 [Candidatus Xenobia bacterium]|jgi:hypothetical protein
MNGELTDEINALAPWHLNVALNSELDVAKALQCRPETGPSHELGPVSFLDSRSHFLDLVKSIYPQGLQGKSFLDCACNCGAYSFWCKEMGAERCFGFDVREHWIRQANFLRQRRAWPSDGIKFQVCDVYDLPKLELPIHQLTMFEGIFYHLPAPIWGLKIAADLTSEVMIFNTASRFRLFGNALSVARENVNFGMNGVHGLNWYPSDPLVLKHIFAWLGFPEVRVLEWRRLIRFNRQRGLKAWLKGLLLGTGRITLLAAREPRYLEAFDRSGYRPRR